MCFTWWSRLARGRRKRQSAALYFCSFRFGPLEARDVLFVILHSCFSCTHITKIVSRDSSYPKGDLCSVVACLFQHHRFAGAHFKIKDGYITVNGFKITGIFPLNRNPFDNKNFLASSITERSQLNCDPSTSKMLRNQYLFPRKLLL